MLHTDVDFSGFEGREITLREIYRYSNFKDFYYRSSDYIHSLRLFYLLHIHKKQIQFFFPNINFEKILVMSLVHDDTEILIGDFQGADRLKLSQKDLADLDNKELHAIEILCKKFPKNICNYNYKSLLTEVLYYDGLEAQVVKFFDHLDGFGEALHEYFAGNKCITIVPVNKYGKSILPFDYYIELFEKAEKKYPLLAGAFRKNQDFYTPFTLDFERINFEGTVGNYIPHTRESIQKNFPYEFYNFWKNSVLDSCENEIIESLILFSKGRLTISD